LVALHLYHLSISWFWPSSCYTKWMEVNMKKSIKSRLCTLFLISSVTAAGSKGSFSNQRYIFKKKTSKLPSTSSSTNLFIYNYNINIPFPKHIFRISHKGATTEPKRQDTKLLIFESDPSMLLIFDNDKKPQVHTQQSPLLASTPLQCPTGSFKQTVGYKDQSFNHSRYTVSYQLLPPRALNPRTTPFSSGEIHTTSRPS
jgi:hypothetical protein